MIGVVTEVDQGAGRIRVRLPAHDDLVSPWLPVVQHGAAGDESMWLPSRDDVVAVAMDARGEEGIALGSIYTDKRPPQQLGTRFLRFADGAELAYDRETHELRIILPAGATVRLEAPGGIALTGDVTVDGHLAVHGDVSDAVGSLAGLRQQHTTHIHATPVGPTDPPTSVP